MWRCGETATLARGDTRRHAPRANRNGFSVRQGVGNRCLSRKAPAPPPPPRSLPRKAAPRRPRLPRKWRGRRRLHPLRLSGMGLPAALNRCRTTETWRRRRRRFQLLERRHDAAVLLLIEQPGGRLAPPGVGAAEGVDEIGAWRQLRRRDGRRPLARDPPDPAAALPLVRSRRCLTTSGMAAGCSMNLPVHVADVEGAVGAVRHVDRAEPVVGRGEELGPRRRGARCGM